MQVASAQQAKTLELRAALSLARLWQSQGRIAKAKHVLADVYHWFSEGYETPELMDAKGVVRDIEWEGLAQERKTFTIRVADSQFSLVPGARWF